MIFDQNRNISFDDLSWRTKLKSAKPSSEHLVSYTMQACMSKCWTKTLNLCNVAFFNTFFINSWCLAHLGFDRFSLCALALKTASTEAHSICSSVVSGFASLQCIGHSTISWTPSQTILLCLQNIVKSELQNVLGDIYQQEIYWQG